MLKKIAKVLGWFVGGAAVIAGLLFIHVWYFKPFSIDIFFAREALQFALRSPETLSSLRILEPMGIDYYNDDLDDASIESGDRMFRQVKDARETLASYDNESLDETDLMSKRIAMSLLDIAVKGEEFRYHNYPVNQMFGVQSNFPSFMESTHLIKDLEDAEDYIARLSKVDTKFSQVLEGLKLREEKDILPPRFLVQRVLDEMNGFVETPAEENILYTSFVDKLDDAGIAKDKYEDLQQRVAHKIEETVYPAYETLIEYFKGLQGEIDTNHGVWKLPNGDEFYRLALRFFTTTDMTPQAIHDLGLREVDRLQSEILSILREQGRAQDMDFEAAIQALKDDPRFYFPDNKEGRERILEEYRDIIEEANEAVEPVFNVMPEAEVAVKRVPEFKEKTAPGAYYQSPSMDGSRPGTFYANLYDIEATPKYGMRTLAYHEAVPGHHFQRAIQQEQEDLPFFRKLAPFTAYTEGWALYAERLAWEIGLQDDPYDNIGRLQAELFRAVRLVVDTGIHYKHWSREQAIDYMLANTGMAESDVVAEIERYFVMPGQATAYKVGMEKILELREHAREALGEKFDLAEFHDVILTNGAVPLTILEDLIDDYIEEMQSESEGAAA